MHRSAHASLTESIADRRAHVGVIGLGYVGLPLALNFVAKGFPVTGFDVDPAKIVALAERRSYLRHIPAEDIDCAATSGRFTATADFARLSEVDAVIICVPTPLGRNREPDLSFVVETAAAVAERLRRGQLVILESTSYPGTTDEIVLPAMARSGLTLESDYFVAYSPEREDPGNPAFHTANIPKIVGGAGPASLELAVALYAAAIDRVIPVASMRVAEAIKIYENTFRSVNIAFANEMKVVFEKMGIDIWEVIEGARSKPFGFMPFYPGPGLGGHCIPIDPYYLAWKARQFGASARFVELAGAVNSEMPDYVVERLASALAERGQPLREAQVLVIGVAYKKNVSDLRESPGLAILEKLLAAGTRVDYHDPHVDVLPRTRDHDLRLRSVALSAESIGAYDAVVILTDHDAVDFELIAASARLIVDSRNAIRNRTGAGKGVVGA